MTKTDIVGQIGRCTGAGCTAKVDSIMTRDVTYLLKAHTTKQGTWALIHVLEGRLVYKIVEPGRPPSNEVLTPTTPPGVIEPAILHEVAPLGPVRFYVEFYRLGEAG